MRTNELATPQFRSDHLIAARPDAASTPPLLICVLGSFRVLRAGQPIVVRGDKTEALLSYLALYHADGVPRAALLDALWPGSETALAAEALYSRLRRLHHLLGAALNGHAPIIQVDGYYRLNTDAGVGVDVAHFEALAATGDKQARAGNVVVAISAYKQAVQLYHGDLCMQTEVPPDPHSLIERERLRSRYLTLLALLGNAAYTSSDNAAALAYAQRLLSQDPCREDAHRLVMRCHVRQGERAQALHQFRVCTDILRATFGATPEPETVALYEQVRRDPASV